MSAWQMDENKSIARLRGAFAKPTSASLCLVWQRRIYRHGLREYIAKMTITRLTGTLESWYRLNKPFVTAVRRQFLHWRAVNDVQKTALFAKARSLLIRDEIG